MNLDEQLKEINLNLANAIKALEIANQQAQETVEKMRAINNPPKKPGLRIVK